MEKTTLAKTRDQYVHNIIVYQKRLEEDEKKKRDNPNYKSKVIVWNLKKKIKRWQEAIDNIDRKRNQIIALANAIAMFTGFSLKDIRAVESRKEKRFLQAKGLYYKFGLENGLSGTDLYEYLTASERAINAYTKTRAATTARMNFTKSFDSTNTRENKELWNRFLLFYKDIKEMSATSTYTDIRKTPGA